MKILDTDHCVAILRGSLDAGAWIPPDEELAITTISLAELTYGAQKSLRPEDNLARLDVFISALSLLPFDEASARRYGHLRASLDQQGQKLADLDLQVASIAMVCQSPLVTHNQAHFSRLAQSFHLILEDWL
ncbi:MAG: type II toxin-antitoxin system VapC family toxin [Anaerolineales bacterium]|nr:type II toxin-antitoxin system VapC family toxin [Anaerolineales bacterium]